MKKLLTIILTLTLWFGVSRAAVLYDFEEGSPQPTWLNATNNVAISSFSHTGSKAVEFYGAPADSDEYKAGNPIILKLPESLDFKRLTFYFHDVYGTNPPYYQYLHLFIDSSTISNSGVRFSMLDIGWGINPPKTANHYHVSGYEEDPYTTSTIGPLRTVGWHNFEVEVLASCPEDGLRNGSLAVTYARKACEDARYIDTLATAYAEVDQFANAIKCERKAMEDPGFLKSDGEGARARLKPYETGRPYREKAEGVP